MLYRVCLVRPSDRAREQARDLARQHLPVPEVEMKRRLASDPPWICQLRRHGQARVFAEVFGRLAGVRVAVVPAFGAADEGDEALRDMREALGAEPAPEEVTPPVRPARPSKKSLTPTPTRPGILRHGQPRTSADTITMEPLDAGRSRVAALAIVPTDTDEDDTIRVPADFVGPRDTAAVELHLDASDTQPLGR